MAPPTRLFAGPVVRCLLLIFDEFIKIFLLSTSEKFKKPKPEPKPKKSNITTKAKNNSNEFREAKSQSRSWSHSLRLGLSRARYLCHDTINAFTLELWLVSWFGSTAVGIDILPQLLPRCPHQAVGLTASRDHTIWYRLSFLLLSLPYPLSLSLCMARTRICISRQLTVLGHNRRTLLGLVVLPRSVSKHSPHTARQLLSLFAPLGPFSKPEGLFSQQSLK